MSRFPFPFLRAFLDVAARRDGRRALARGAYPLLVIVLALLVVLYGRVPHVAASGTLAPRTLTDFKAVDQYVAAELDAAGVPGAAMAIVYGEQIVHLQGFGIAGPSRQPVTPQTAFNIGSIAKTLTALAIMQLVDAGQIDLDAPVQRYLPWFRVGDPEASAQIRVIHLLNHQSGIPEAAGNDYPDRDDLADDALERRVRALSAVSLERTVGERHEYSNANYDVLGLIVQAVSGQPYEVYIQQRVFTPLGMRHSFFSREQAQMHGLATGHRQWFGIPVPYREATPRPHLPSGHQFSSAEDLGRLLLVYSSGGRFEGRRIVSPESLHAMQNTPASSGPGCATYSMHWSRRSRCEVRRLGLSGDAANYKARVLVAPEEGWGVVLLMNAQAVGLNGPRQEGIKDGVLDLLLGEDPEPGSPHNELIAGSTLVIALVTAALAVEAGRSVARMRRRGALPRAKWRVAVPLLIEISWVLLLAGAAQAAVGTRSDWALRFMLETVPDLGWLIVSSAILALGWGIVRTLMTLSMMDGVRTEGGR
jgi:CubicO group peptidase (beta-lactamase class C family)